MLRDVLKTLQYSVISDTRIVINPTTKFTNENKRQFDIKGSFELKERGLVIYGDIIEGTINKQDFITIKDGQQTIKLEIKSVEVLDKMQEKDFKIGLTFYYESDKQRDILQKLQVLKQTTEITAG